MGTWFFSSRKLLYSSVVVLLIIFFLQIWVCCDCRAGAIRILPGNGMRKMTESQGMKDNKGKGDLFQKYFNGRSFSFNKTDRGFEESKRRVPSCPDPLHN
ncbi:Clavata3/esr-related 43, putative [Theobroma cacao]|uniref:Clavata3/esr-related 43, putative n=1 Tax=Theobroma cacao TaxID=3641 RepID=A0A061E6F8_THECC|nr:Clavata3/esr-related 43, putative [Theobroma cacao]